MNHTTSLQSTAMPFRPEFRPRDVAPALRLVWRWLMAEKQLAADPAFENEFVDTQWQDTHWTSGSQEVPVIRCRAV